MKNKIKITKRKKKSNPVAKALLTSTELNIKPKIVPSKKKYDRTKEKYKIKGELLC